MPNKLPLPCPPTWQRHGPLQRRGVDVGFSVSCSRRFESTGLIQPLLIQSLLIQPSLIQFVSTVYINGLYQLLRLSSTVCIDEVGFLKGCSPQKMMRFALRTSGDSVPCMTASRHAQSSNFPNKCLLVSSGCIHSLAVSIRYIHPHAVSILRPEISPRQYGRLGTAACHSPSAPMGLALALTTFIASLYEMLRRKAPEA